MAGNFMPETRTMPVGRGYMAVYRLFDRDNFKKVMKEGKTAIYPTRSMAKKSAEAVLKRILNPPIQSECSKPASVRSPGFALQEKRLRNKAEMQKKAFGGVIIKSRVAVVEEAANGKRGKIRFSKQNACS